MESMRERDEVTESLKCRLQLSKTAEPGERLSVLFLTIVYACSIAKASPSE